MTYVKQMQRIVDEYRLEGLNWPTSAKNIADWAISTGRWELPAAAIRRRCADDIASAMREEYMTDRKGRRVRLLHPAPLSTEGQTEMIWDDIRRCSAARASILTRSRRRCRRGWSRRRRRAKALAIRQ